MNRWWWPWGKKCVAQPPERRQYEREKRAIRHKVEREIAQVRRQQRGR